ncbi:MAG: hypothetical protein GC151_18990 [Betaproteobacteria bacterium]|nr:hypothetical protein [Betaproteobacteria bacterium]
MTTAPRRTRVVAIWIVLLALVGVIVAIQMKDRAALHEEERVARAGMSRDRMMIAVPVEQLGVIEIAHAGVVHRFERDAAGLWFYHGVHAKTQGTHGHQADPAVAARIDKAFAGLGRARMEREFPFDPKAQDYGLTMPQTLLLVYPLGQTQPLAQFAFGDLAPDGYSRYVLRLGAANVFTVANYQLDNLLDLVKAVNLPATSGASGTTAGDAPEAQVR